jgi:metallo-beta-lactamase family protein
MSFELQFLGGAGTVTGSKYLLTVNNQNILIDCGLFQGLKNLRLKNWDPFPIEPSKISAIVLTHAHIDHSGYIPRLIAEGFQGKIYSTHATRDLCKILLPDCGYLMEEEAAYLNRIKKTKHEPALPFFTIAQAEAALRFFEPVSFGKYQTLGSDFGFEFQYVGHILGAASVIVHVGDRKIGFTGDVGRLNDPIFHAPAPLPGIDYLVTESTYGDRLHASTDMLDHLEKIIKQAYQKNGVILIPAFAVGRSMLVMYCLSVLRKQNRIPSFPIFLNSPMATNSSDVFFEYKDLHKLSNEECRYIGQIVKYIQNQEESIALNGKKGPMLIISASGMLTGGRILHHIKAFAPDPNNTILLTGYQTEGTRGHALINGAKELKIHGAYVPINASVEAIDMSAHADYNEMLQWFAQSKIKPRKIFITHGAPSASDHFRLKLHDTFGWDCVIPEHQAKFVLE